MKSLRECMENDTFDSLLKIPNMLPPGEAYNIYMSKISIDRRSKYISLPNEFHKISDILYRHLKKKLKR